MSAQLTDRELLEFAAKAAGIELIDWHDCWADVGPGYRRLQDGLREAWNPLNDDGDALRLAVNLRMELMLRLDSDSVMTYFEVAGRGLNAAERPSENNGDVHAAVRRVFVRSAAEIGKAIP